MTFLEGISNFEFEIWRSLNKPWMDLGFSQSSKSKNVNMGISTEKMMQSVKIEPWMLGCILNALD